jgi:glutamyl-Q tRNA(Asp) synthetase
VAREIAAIGHAPHGPDGPLYPGTCRRLSDAERQQRLRRGDAYALRLDVAAAARRAGKLHWRDLARGAQTARPELFGDVVLARKDVAASYHLAVTVDDALQGVTLVTRGEDLFAASHLHRLLQALLDLPVPDWHHHPLLTDQSGQRLAKRAGAPSIRGLREAGVSAAEVLRQASAGPADGPPSPAPSGGPPAHGYRSASS